MINKKILLYNLEGINISKLKENNDFNVKEIELNKIKNYLDKYNIKGFTAEDPNYHFKFSKIYSSPYIIYYKGNLDLINYKIIGIVGPRRPSNYGIKFLEIFFEKIKDLKGIVTVSGLAQGIDSITHNLSIKYNIPTIAVLGGGFDYFIKYKNKDLENILSHNGLILSEFKLFQKPEKYTFPQRNRIIAGLCDILIVPEAGEKSGSLITVDFAIKMKKEVYGLPNNIFQPTSKGINKYIFLGYIKSIYDIDILLEEITEKLNLNKKGKNKKSIDLSEQEKQLLDQIKQGNNSLMLLNLNTDFEIGEILTLISQLETKGIIKEINGEYEIL